MADLLTESKTLCDIEVSSIKQQELQREMCRQSFAYFLSYVKTEDVQRGLGVIPFPVDFAYLIRVANELQYNRLNIILKSRQMLITWLMAAKVVWRANFNQSIDYPILSRNEDIAKAITNRVWTIQENLPEWMQAKSIKRSLEIEYPNLKCIIRSMPNTEDTARSLSTGDFMIDEAAFLKWGSKTYGAIRPVIDKYGNMDVCSTPNLRDGLFHPLWHNDNSDYNKIIVHWSEHPLRDDSWAEAMRKDLGESRWKQEYELSFTAVAGKPVYSNFKAEQIKPCYDTWNKRYTLIIGWDKGFHFPGVVFCYINSDDQLCIAKEFMGVDTGRDKFIPLVKEKLETWFPDADKINWCPSDFFTKSQTDGKKWSDVMKTYGFTARQGKAGSDEVERRTDAVRSRLSLREDKLFGALVDPSCETLIEGFQGAYHYPERIDKPQDEKPEKDGYYDHLQDALAVICDNHFDILGRAEEKPKRAKYRIDRHPVTGRVMRKVRVG